MKQITAFCLVAATVATSAFAAEPENKSETALAEARKAIDKGNAQWIDA